MGHAKHLSGICKLQRRGKKSQHTNKPAVHFVSSSLPASQDYGGRHRCKRTLAIPPTRSELLQSPAPWQAGRSKTTPASPEERRCRCLQELQGWGWAALAAAAAQRGAGGLALSSLPNQLLSPYPAPTAPALTPISADGDPGQRPSFPLPSLLPAASSGSRGAASL